MAMGTRGSDEVRDGDGGDGGGGGKWNAAGNIIT